MTNSFYRKFLLPLTLCVAAGFSLSSCMFFKEKKELYLPVQMSEGGAWCFINEKGERVGTQEWEFEPTITKDGIFTARNDEGLTVYSWDGDEAKPIDSLVNLVSVGIYNEGLLAVTPQMQRIRIVDRKGDIKFVLDPINGQEVSSCANKFQEGLLIVTTADGKTGVVNTEGEVVVKPKYSEISNFNNGYALAVNYNFDNYDAGPSYFILDKEGNAKSVKGEFGYEEGECSQLPEFQDGFVEVPGKVIENGEEYEYPRYKITTEGKVSKAKGYTWVTMLEDGGQITKTYSDDKNIQEWKDKEGNVVKKISKDGEYMDAYGNYVTIKEEDKLTVYSAKDGEKLTKLTGNVSGYWSEGNFGLVVMEYGKDYSDVTYKLLDEQGQPIPNATYYGVGIKESLDLSDDSDYEEVGCPLNTVTSAYVDVTAAATKLAQMITEGVKGKSYYYLGESVSTILEGSNANWYSGNTRNFTIPCDTSTYYLATGAGFWINGTGEATQDIVSPTYQHYFEVHHYDYYGRAWGWNRTRQVGVHFNPNSKVLAFDLKLHTNHASGARLREALGRRLKKDGYTLKEESANYEEYTNGYRNVIVYGNKESTGIGAIVYEKDSGFWKSDDDKASLAAQIGRY